MSQINIGNLTIDKFYLGDSNNVKIYLGEIKLYPTDVPPTPSGNCYKIISTPITSYTSTDYSSVYSFADTKWYMLNNLNRYEEYGIFETGTSLSDFTYYPTKLVIVGETEYQYQSNGWVEVGEYIDVQTTYEITMYNSTDFEGKELSTTFKIPYADFEDSFMPDLIISTEDGDNLVIKKDKYECGFYDGTVTNDGIYYYFSLPNDAPSSVVIESIEYMSSVPIHLIFGSKQVSVQYDEKEVPTAKVYNTVEEMEAVGCPTVGVNEYAFVGNNLYKYFVNEQWDGVTYYEPKMVAFYENGNPLVVYENGSGDLTQSETKIIDVSPISVYIGDNVTNIDNEAFYGSSCQSVTFSENSQLISIDYNAFQNCSGLTSVTIPSSVTSIGASAFNGCTGLTSVTIPNSVTSIGASAFNNTPWWNTYSADTSHHYGNIIYINDVAYKATSSEITSCTFREGTVSIGQYAFRNCSSLTSVTIPDSVTSISNGAFYNCSNLTSITIGNSVTSIGYYAFQGCTGLTSITIPNSVTSIGSQSFQSCSGLTSVTIPSGVTSIGQYAFYKCSGLTSVTVEATTPPTLGLNVFNNTNNCPIYVPSQSVNAYKTATNWKTWASRIQAIPSE